MCAMILVFIAGFFVGSVSLMKVLNRNEKRNPGYIMKWFNL
jgi:hypothetical protein